MNANPRTTAPLETQPLRGERLIMALFAAGGLSSLAGAIALMGLLMHFLSGGDLAP